MQYVDFVNLCPFDFYNAERTPALADYHAPLLGLVGRSENENAKAIVNFW